MMDNSSCVFITGGLVPPFKFAAGGKRFGEFVSGGSPNPSLQALAVTLLDAQIEAPRVASCSSSSGCSAL